MVPARIPALLLLALWFSPAPAGAFERSRDPDNESVCLWWKSRSIVYYINESCSDDMNIEHCLRAVQDAFQVWNVVPGADFQLVYGGTTPRRDVGFDEQNWSNNINLVIWYEDSWLGGDRSAIALTTNTYDSSNGEIVDADIEMNGVYFTFSTPESSYTITDIQNTLVHEVGHVVGLDHSSDSNASMFATAQQGETIKRDLSQDDTDGMSFIYPLNASTPLCGDPPAERGCRCQTVGAIPLAGLLLALLFFIALRRTRRKGR